MADGSEDVPGERDFYRDTPVRYLGYANEVGEAFRNIVHRNFVRLSYGISGAYVFADALSKSRHPDAPTIRTFVDVAIWQGLASVAIPGFTINRICWATGHLLRGSRHRMTVVTGVGLLAIPFIIKPIDHGVDVLMDRAIRPFLLEKVL